MQNDIIATILENGTVRIDTENFSSSAHVAAEAAMLWIAQEMGGAVSRVGNTKTHTHIHNHDHAHAHGIAHTH
jgi:hypothetical protein